MTTPFTPYEETRNALNVILDYIGTDEFLKLPAAARQEVLNRMKELIIQASPKSSLKERA